MAWYDEILNQASNPLTGVGEKFKDLNILGASVPKQYEQMQQAGLLGPGVYEAAIQDADTRGKRNALIQGLLAYGTQDFNKGYGSILPYLAKPVAAAMGAAQQTYDELPQDAMRNIELSQFKRKQDLETDRLAMIEKLKSSSNISDSEREMLPFMTMAQLIEANKPTTYKAPTTNKRYFTKDGVRYIQDQIFDNSKGTFSDVGEPRTEFKPTEYEPSNPTKTQIETIKVKLGKKFPGLSNDAITESVGYIWDAVDKDIFTNKSPLNITVDNVIKDFENKGVLTNEETFWGFGPDTTKLNPERISGDNVMQTPEEVVEEEAQVVAKPSSGLQGRGRKQAEEAMKEKESEVKQKPKTIVFKKIVYRLGTDGKYYPIK